MPTIAALTYTRKLNLSSELALSHSQCGNNGGRWVRACGTKKKLAKEPCGNPATLIRTPWILPEALVTVPFRYDHRTSFPWAVSGWFRTHHQPKETTLANNIEYYSVAERNTLYPSLLTTREHVYVPSGHTYMVKSHREQSYQRRLTVKYFEDAIPRTTIAGAHKSTAH